MNPTILNLLDSIDQTILTPVVQALLNRETVQVIDWTCTKIHGGGGDTYDTGQAGVYRFAGRASGDGQICAWQLIFKVFDKSTGQTEPSHLHYWQRELVFWPQSLIHPWQVEKVAIK